MHNTITNSGIHDPDQLLTPTETADYLSLTTKALETWRWKGNGPKFVRVSNNVVRYRRSDLLKWIDLHVIDAGGEGVK